MIRAIIFDFFDVIRTDGYNRWLKQHDLDHSGAFLAASDRNDRGEISDTEFFQALSQASGEPAHQIENDMESNNELNRPLVDYINTLRTKYKIALLSNSSSKYLRDELAKYDLEKYFDEIVISSEVGLIKPEPEVFEYIMRKLNVQPEECVFIDDKPRHVIAATKLGINGITFVDVSSLKQDLKRILK